MTQNLYNPDQTFANHMGSVGLLRTASAVPAENGDFGVLGLGSFFFQDPFIDANKHSRNRLRLSGFYQFPWNIQAFGGFMFTFNESSTSVRSRSATSFLENTDLGVKWSTPIFDDFIYIGGLGVGRFFSGTRQLRNTSGYTDEKSGALMQAHLLFLSSFDFKKFIPKIPVKAHYNLGYRSPNGDLLPPATSPSADRTQQVDIFNRDSFRYHAIVNKIGVEVPFRYVNPFIEYWSEFAIGGQDDVSFSDNRQKFTMGAQIIPHPVVAILLAGDLGIGGNNAGQVVGIPENPDWELHFGISFASNSRNIFDPIGDLQGQVVDAETGLALPDVTVRVLGDLAVPQASNSTGMYQIRNLDEGEYQVEFSKEGYKTRIEKVRVRAQRLNNLDINLQPPGPPAGNLVGEIFDATTGEPIARAYVEIDGLEQSLSTSEQGTFNAQDIPAGLRNMRVEAPGYVAQDFPVEIFDGEEITQRFSLMREGPKSGQFTGTVTNEDGTGLTAVFTVEGGSISPFGTDPLTGQFNQSLLSGTYKVKVQAQNYLPEEFDLEVVAGESLERNIILKKPETAVVVDNQIVLPDAIFFSVDSDVIDEQSYEILNQVAEILKANPNFKLLRIEGHTDSDGSEAYNKQLSQRRAESVRQFLIRQGVDALNLEAFGFGESKPIATNLTDEGKAENRRVEFNLVRSNP